MKVQNEIKEQTKVVFSIFFQDFNGTFDSGTLVVDSTFFIFVSLLSTLRGVFVMPDPKYYSV